MKAMDRATGGVSAPARRWAVTWGVLLLSGAACLAQALPPAAPERVIVEDVIVQGNRNVPTGKVMGIIKTRAGTEYKRDVVADDVRHLYETKAFADIRVQELTSADKKKITVYFQVRELPSMVREVVYKGNNHMSPEDLDGVSGIRKDVPLNPVANQQACQAILRKYHEKGRLMASVDLVEGGQVGDTRVVFNITEGPVVRVKDISFTGAHFVSAARLRTQVNSSAAFLGIGGTFNALAADADVLALEHYYRSFGFHDVRVARELAWDADQHYVHLIFHVEEGQRYKVANIDVASSAIMSRDELVKLEKLKPGEFYNQATVDADEKRMQYAIGYRGREATTHEQITYKENNQVDVLYQIEEKAPARVGQIFIIGNDVTRENVIRRQVPLYPGQVLTYPDLRAAEANLSKLNIFENNPETGVRPTVEVVDRDANSEYKDILVRVNETATGSLMFGVGVNSDAGLTGSIVLNERNFDITRPPTSFDDLLSGHAWRGAGEEFRIEAVPGTQLQRYTVSFKEPFLFDTPYSLGVSAYYYDRVFNEYTEDRVGARFTLGRQLNKQWSVSAGIRVEEVGVHDIPLGAPPEITDYQGNHPLVGLRAGVTRDTRDSFLRATEGSLVDVSFEECLGDYTFPLFNVEANKYFTIYQRPDGSGRQVLAARSQLSIAGDNTPVYERFYAGGFRSMRGFEFRGVGPDIDGFKVGGDFMWLNSLEYQIPIKANDQIYLVGFVDSGTVEQHVELGTYRVSTGVGIRIVVPLLGPVPIALDFGFPIVKAPEDNKQVFSFWVGFFH